MVTTSQLDEHYGYLSDTRRMELLRIAIKSVVRPGDHVLDLACGTGILGLFCLDAGAAKVTFIDRTDMIDIARQSMMTAGYSERCTFIRSQSLDATIPQRVDLIVSDNIGFFGIDYEALSMLKDAKDRFLKDGGLVFPERLRLFASLVSLQDQITPATRWARPDIPDTFQWLGNLSANFKWPAKQETTIPLSVAVHLATFELGDDSPEFVSWAEELAVEQSGEADGILGWFEADLTSQHFMTNEPASSDRIDRPQAFFPFEKALPITRGEHVKISIKARPNDHIWVWQAEGSEMRAHRFQSTANALSPEKLKSSDWNAPLQLKKNAKLLRTVLNCCDGSRTARDIEDIAVKECDDLFPTEESLRAAVRRELVRYSEAFDDMK